MSKEQRLSDINHLIHLISSTGRRFFYKNGNVASMILKSGHIYFVDDYTRKAVRVVNNYRDWNGLSHGGTIRALILDFAEFIRSGKPSNGKHGYGGLLSNDWRHTNLQHQPILDFAVAIGFLEHKEDFK